MTRLVFALVAALLPATAQAQCFAVTPSGKAAFERLLTPAEQCAARAEGKRRGCSEATVPEGTPNAIDAALARELVPHVRREMSAARCAPAPATRRRQESPAAKVIVRKPAAPPLQSAPIPLPRPVMADPPQAAPAFELPPIEPAPFVFPAPRPTGFLAWLLGLFNW